MRAITAKIETNCWSCWQVNEYNHSDGSSLYWVQGWLGIMGVVFFSVEVRLVRRDCKSRWKAWHIVIYLDRRNVLIMLELVNQDNQPDGICYFNKLIFWYVVLRHLLDAMKMWNDDLIFAVKEILPLRKDGSKQ